LNKEGQVSGIATQTTEMLDLLQHKNIRIGTKLEVRRKFSFDNSLEIRIRNQPTVTISGEVAKNIWVRNEE